MKIKNGFLLHSMGEEHLAVPVDERTKEFHGVVRMNDTGVFLWQLMQEEISREAVIAALQKEYGIDETLAAQAAETFLKQLKEAEMLEQSE